MTFFVCQIICLVIRSKQTRLPTASPPKSASVRHACSTSSVRPFSPIRRAASCTPLISVGNAVTAWKDHVPGIRGSAGEKSAEPSHGAASASDASLASLLGFAARINHPYRKASLAVILLETRRPWTRTASATARAVLIAQAVPLFLCRPSDLAQICVRTKTYGSCKHLKCDLELTLSSSPCGSDYLGA